MNPTYSLSTLLYQDPASVVFAWHADPGHEWLAVSYREIRSVGLGVRDFSGYSYIDLPKMTMYLEGDCDAGVFINAYAAKHGVRPSFKTIMHDGPGDPECFIRSLPRNSGREG